MRVINILHISDLHVQKNNMGEIKEIIQKLIDDIKKVQKQKNISIDLICFTGDLVQRGDKALRDEMQWRLAIDIFVNPLLRELSLSKEEFIFVPGNHEVDITKIVPRLEKGLEVDSLQDIKDVMDHFDISYNSRLSYFYKIVKEQLLDVKMKNLGYSYCKHINGINVGISCIDSAWRSSGKGKEEKGKLYVGTKQIRELYNEIAESDIKICMMHHPIDWLEEYEALEIEKELAKYDLVLQGHVHEEDLKQVVRRELKTVYSTVGKLYPLDYAEGRALDGYNGYSILNIEYDLCKCNVYLRTYFGKNRKEFDAGIDICPSGEESYDICSKMEDHQLKFNLIKGIAQYFYNMSEKYTLIKEADAKSPENIRQILVEPVLSEKSEYVKENGDVESKEVSIHNLMNINDNILLIGKKETGKTTILQQLGLRYIEEYNSKGIVPIYVNMKYLPKGANRLVNSTIQFVQTHILDNEAISKKDIVDILSAGKMVFLIDNVKTEDANHAKWIQEFIGTYKSNRFILTIEEEFFQSLDIKQIPDYGTIFKEVYIQYMGKSQIRSMVTKWAKGRENTINIAETVNKIDSYCNQINFAKTPFNIAVFMVIWDENSNFVPSNECIVMENYLEIVLEKLSSNESLRSTYAFKLKQNFLSYIAHQMYLKNEYFLTKEEFDVITKKYHQLKGYNIGKSRFDVIFFEKNILSYSGEYIVFSHTSFLEYFLAIYAFNNKEFLNEIIKKGNRIFFRNEICFYSGMNQDCTELLDSFSADILNVVVEYIDLVDDLNEMSIMNEFKMDREQLISDIQKNRPTQEELDAASDSLSPYEEKKPTEINKVKIMENDAEDFYSLLQMYGSIIKNAELLDNKYKIEHLEYYMYGMNMLYAIMIKLFEHMRKEFKFEELSDNDKRHLKINTEEEFEKMKVQMVDITKLIFPIAIQNLILENVGSPKLEAAINELIARNQNKPFEKFMLMFLKCDLGINSLKSILGQYIKGEESKDILKIALLKLTFYYRVRFFGNSIHIDKELIDLITEIHMKLNPQKEQNFHKSEIEKDIKFQLDNKR